MAQCVLCALRVEGLCAELMFCKALAASGRAPGLITESKSNTKSEIKVFRLYIFPCVGGPQLFNQVRVYRAIRIHP